MDDPWKMERHMISTWC